MRAGRGYPIAAHLASQWHVLYGRITGGPATGGGSAQAPAVVVVANCGIATATGAAYGATPGSSTEVRAGIGVAEGLAYTGYIETPGFAQPNAAGSTGAVPIPNPIVIVGGGEGGIGFEPGGINDHGVTVFPSTAQATGVAYGVRKLATTTLATGAGTAYNPSTTSDATDTTAIGASAGATATATVTQIVRPTAGSASATGTAHVASPSALGNPNTGTGTCEDPSPGIGPSPASATALGAAHNPTIRLRLRRDYDARQARARWRTWSSEDAWSTASMTTRLRVRSIDVVTDELVGLP